jgi:hypothetical protein
MRRCGQEGLGQNQSIRRDNRSVSASGVHASYYVGGPERRGLEKGESVFLRELFDGARSVLLTSSRRPVGLGKHQSDLVASAMQCRKRSLCELGSSGED